MVQRPSVTIKDHFRETHQFQQRLLITVIITIVLILVLIARLFFLQVINHTHYTTLSEENRLNILPIAPIRGLIYDRNGVLLAQNLPSFTLQIVPEHTKNLAKTLAELRKIIAISDDEVVQFKKLLKKKRRFEGIPLRYRLNDVERAKIAVNQDHMPGVRIEAQLTRDYPQGKLASHAIGYVGRINEEELRKLNAVRYSATEYIGKVGVERSYEDILHGEVGTVRVETNSQGRVMNSETEINPEPGKDLYMTLDIRVQQIAEKAFADNNGALVALDPRSGEVIAFVSIPTFDPNLFVNGINARTYKELSTSTDRPLFNRALQGQYPPGSTIKPFIGLAGLEDNLITADETIKCPGYYMLKNDDRKYRDWKKQGHGETNLTKAIVESCDVYFYDLAMALKIDRMESFLSLFGVGKATGIDIRGEADGLLPSRTWKRKTYHLPWFPGETLITGIGQGFTLTTPLQLASMTATLGTRGEHFKPRIIHAIGEPGTEEVTLLKPRFVGEIPKQNPKHWDTIIDAMAKVVNSVHGTARRISHDLKYTVAGKTGTAQVFGVKEDEEYDEEKIAKKLRDHALFLAFAPVDEPRIAIAVIVENGGHGGSAAAPIARKVMDAYLLKDE
jgi:penicillin-binding protein 2